MRHTIGIVMLCWPLMATGTDAAAQGRRSDTAFEPARRIFSGLFPVRSRGRLRVATRSPRQTIRERTANRFCEDCDTRPANVHVIIDSPLLHDDWLERHTYQANGGSFGDNAVVADFWYDAVHRRIMSRSAGFRDVDDPADLRLGRAPGLYPNGLDFAATLPEGTTVGQVGFESWSHNGFGAYFAAIQGTIRDTATGYLDLAMATGKPGRARSGFTFAAGELVRHVRLHASGMLEVGFDTDPDARPTTSLLVRGDEHVEGSLRVGDAAEVGTLRVAHAADVRTLQVEGVARAGALLVTGPGGNVPHACELRQATTRETRDARVSCGQDRLAIGGGGVCGSGDLKGSRPMQAGTIPDTWEITCTRKGGHTVYAVCCDR